MLLIEEEQDRVTPHVMNLEGDVLLKIDAKEEILKFV